MENKQDRMTESQEKWPLFRIGGGHIQLLGEGKGADVNLRFVGPPGDSNQVPVEPKPPEPRDVSSKDDTSMGRHGVYFSMMS